MECATTFLHSQIIIFKYTNQCCKHFAILDMYLKQELILLSNFSYQFRKDRRDTPRGEGRGRGRGRGGRGRHEVVASASVFSMGPAEKGKSGNIPDEE